MESAHIKQKRDFTHHKKKANHKPNLQLICCPIGSPNTEFGLGRANLNLATLWLSSVLLTSLNSLKFSGSKHPIKNMPSHQSICTNPDLYPRSYKLWLHNHENQFSICQSKEAEIANNSNQAPIPTNESSHFASKLIKQLINSKTWALLTNNN